MKTGWLIGTFLLGLAAPVAAQRPTSAYTQLDPLRCEVLEQITEGASARWRCPGRGGIPLYLNTGDDRFDLDAGVDNEVWESLDPLNSIGPTVEWRLHGGREQIEPQIRRADRVRLFHDQLTPRVESRAGSRERECDEESKETEHGPVDG